MSLPDNFDPETGTLKLDPLEYPEPNKQGDSKSLPEGFDPVRLTLPVEEKSLEEKIAKLRGCKGAALVEKDDSQSFEEKGSISKPNAAAIKVAEIVKEKYQKNLKR